MISSKKLIGSRILSGSRSANLMFVVLYRWRLKPDFEDQFVEAWGEVTKYYLENFDSLGSRLHEGSDGIWYAYAQWKSEAQRKNASEKSSGIENAFANMGEAVDERFPEVRLKIQSDMLKSEG